MSIELYSSNSLEALADQLSDNLNGDRYGVFAKPFIVTQTEGINSWLKIELAEKLGIVSNVAFISPTDLVAQVFSAVGGGFQKPMHSEHMKWLIFELLGEATFIQCFPKIYSYYANNETKRLSLAKKAADLFDQYQIYRPEKIAAWSNGELEQDSDLQWQAYLWNKIKLKFADTLSDKTMMAEKIISLLNDKSNQEMLVQKIPHLYFFGLAIITPFYLKLFYELSRYIPVRFYLINPSPDTYWMEDVTEKRMTILLNRNKKQSSSDFTIGNDLLLNWGKIINDSFTLLFNNDELINLYDDSLRQPPLASSSLLQKIQTDIYNNAAQDSRVEILSENIVDGSITINAAYTPSREVEILYNYLIQLIDEDKAKLSPRDIVVMVNDIDKYAPFINAVFENAPYKIPYSIADESLASGNNFFSALSLLLAIDDNKFTSERVLELLENKYIRTRFGINDVSLIRKTIAEANIVFGITGSRENDTRFLSWEYGLRKIILGICISGGEHLIYKDEEIQPIDFIEGDDSFELIRFYHFVTVLIDFIKERKSNRSLDNWIAYIKSLAEEMVFESGTADDDDFHLFIKQLEKSESAAQLVSNDIQFDTFKMAFEELLSHEKRNHSFLRGGITFCSFIPMRSIPFKVVCLLGLDFDKFPRKENPLSFSLFNKAFLKGDRNVKDNDKHLFLETILSARSFLYLSYIGSNIKDGNPIPPSSLVDELIDYIIKGVKGNSDELRKKLVTQHPLHGFSQRYFNQSGLVSYLSDDAFKTQDDSSETASEENGLDFSEIDIKQLASFFKDPVKSYFSKVLKINYYKEDLLLPEMEKFEIKSLDKWIVVSEWIKSSETNPYRFAKEKIKSGSIPLNNTGIVEFENISREFADLKELVKEAMNGKPEKKVGGSVVVSNHKVTGSVDGVFENSVVAYCHSSSIYSYFIESYIRYVFTRACGHEFNFEFLYCYKKTTKRFTIDSSQINQETAMEMLEKWVGYYIKGHESLFHFYPKFSDPLGFVADDYNHFISSCEKDIFNAFTKKNPDEHFVIAYENGYLNEEHFESFKENTNSILGATNFKP